MSAGAEHIILKAAEPAAPADELRTVDEQAALWRVSKATIWRLGCTACRSSGSTTAAISVCARRT